jgi:hypothetical protein
VCYSMNIGGNCGPKWSFCAWAFISARFKNAFKSALGSMNFEPKKKLIEKRLEKRGTLLLVQQQ